LSCEDIQIFPEKSDERKYLFGLKACADPELLVRVAGIGWDFFCHQPTSSLDLLTD
jgi:hypothetical protein